MGTGDMIQILKYDPCSQINQLYLFVLSLLKCVYHFFHTSFTPIHWYMNSSIYKYDSYTHKDTHACTCLKEDTQTNFECDWNDKGMTSHPEVYQLLYYSISMNYSPELTFWFWNNSFLPDDCLPVWSILPNSQIGKNMLQCDFPLFQLAPA